MSSLSVPDCRSVLQELVPIAGEWSLEENRATYLGHEEAPLRIGVALARQRTKAGQFRTEVELPQDKNGDACARIVFGYDSAEREGYSAGLGGYNRAYVVSYFKLGRYSRNRCSIGRPSMLRRGKRYELLVSLRGQQIVIHVDGVKVLNYILPQPLTGDQVGLAAHGDGGVIFHSFKVTSAKPRAFVVMQFSEPFDSFWREVIKPVAEEKGFEVYRADDVYRPGTILQDIVRGIETADVIIAEVTPANPNVFYELGYAHAVGTPTILLAQHPGKNGNGLPFDISGFRCIFYEDAIRGKSEVEESLRRHLSNILDRDPNTA